MFAEVLGFPDFYGRNLSAWVDCLTRADEVGLICPALIVPDGDVLTLQLGTLGDFPERCTEQYEALVECASFVNWRRIDIDARSIVALSFYK